MIRPPAVAGSFYPQDSGELTGLLQQLTRQGDSGPGTIATAVMVPHAGYVYSGAVAGAVFTAVQLPRRYVILCPNHHGRGAPFSAYLHGEWATPLGQVAVDEELAGALASRFPRLRHDPVAHEREHSLEVQLPFLQHLLGEFRFVPICVASHDLDDLLELGEALAGAMASTEEPTLLIISSDMSHYISAEAARELDQKALEPLQRLDAEELHAAVHGGGISMCGIAPAVAGAAAARKLGATSGKLIAYANSGDTTGDYTEVVAYAGMVFS
ncbi:MAG: AmmeMemoRadiSam system protein B [Acidobacteria bacterium]|nr:MAG: AmmeMemoRadiSam system protein B [Acidobacteriota bacterium]